MSQSILMEDLSGRIASYTAIALQRNADLYKAGLEQFTLSKTGETKQTATIQFTPTGFRLDYNTYYSQWIYHNPKIRKPTTPGTSSYWDNMYYNSDSYDYFISQVDGDIERMLNNG